MLPCRVLRLYGMLEKVSDRQQHYRKAETAGSQLLQCLLDELFWIFSRSILNIDALFVDDLLA